MNPIPIYFTIVAGAIGYGFGGGTGLAIGISIAATVVLWATLSD